jgi:hypothetical protein
MAHDLLAELDGYRAELDGYERSGRTARTEAVRGEIDRVTKQIAGEVEKLNAQADNHEEAGQDVLAAQARVQAKRLRRALAAEQLPGGEDTADRMPRQTATTKRKGS